MKLQGIKQTLQNVRGSINLTRQDVARAGGNYWMYRNVKIFRRIISELKNTGLFKSLIYEIESSELYESGGDDIIVEPNRGVVLDEQINRLRVLVSEMFESLKEIVGDAEEHTVNIKLDSIQDFEDLSNASKDLQKIIGQIVLEPEIGGKVEIISVENGSFWFEVAVGTSAAVAILARIATIATNIHSKILYNRILSAKAQVAQVDANRHQMLADYEAKLLEVYVDIETNSAERDFFKAHQQERQNKLKNGVNLLLGLMNKGCELRPGLNAPEEIKSQFPNENLLDAIKEQIKLLENKKDAGKQGIEENSDPEHE